mmetsp:Transcript_82493/g.233971  ORF Transcript_82493/g.233971 Transcript_82493/m.233971 type:complete len:433 (+) Transcript_82493:431-1729(+)
MHRPAAPVLAQPRTQQLRVDAPAAEVVAEAEHAAPAARRVGVPAPREARRDPPAAALPAEPLGHPPRVGDLPRHDRVHLLFPRVGAELLLLFLLHALSLLVRPAELPAMLLAYGLQAPRDVAVLAVPLMRHQALDVPGEGDRPVDLGLLVLHPAHLPRVPHQRLLARDRHLHRLAELLPVVLREHVRVVVEDGEPVGLEVRGVFGRERAAEPDIPEHDVGVAVLRALDDAAGVVHGVQHAVLAALECRGALVAAAEEVLLPDLADFDIQQAAGAGRLKLVSIVRVFLHERQHLVQVHVDQDRRELPDPGERHPQLAVGVAHPAHPPLQLRQRPLVVALGQDADVPDRPLLAHVQLRDHVEFRYRGHQLPVRLLVVSYRHLQKVQPQCRRLHPGPEADAPGRLLPPDLEQLEAATHARDVLVELREAHLAIAV